MQRLVCFIALTDIVEEIQKTWQAPKWMHEMGCFLVDNPHFSQLFSELCPSVVVNKFL